MTIQPAKRVGPYPLSYHKTRLIDLSRLPHPYPHLLGTEAPIPPKSLADSIQHPQLYIPSYQRFFELNDHNYQQVSLNHRYHVRTLEEVVDIDPPCLITDDIRKAPVFIKYSPLLDPIKYMVGKYDLSDPATKRPPPIFTISRSR